jgi:putative hydrolase of HD superfamily
MLKKKMDMNLLNLVGFFETVGKLKATARSGWVEAGIQKTESVADHIFRTAIICMIYSDLEGLDELKVLRMALIHDLPEAITGDLTPLKKTRGSKKKENETMNQILSLLPEEHRKKYLTTWKEYQTGKTREAKAVRQIDKLEMALQAKEYENARLTRQDLKRFMDSAEKVMEWSQLKHLFSYIQGETPQ